MAPFPRLSLVCNIGERALLLYSAADGQNPQKLGLRRPSPKHRARMKTGIYL